MGSAIGTKDGAQSSGMSAIAFGTNAKAFGDGAVAIGYHFRPPIGPEKSQ